MRIFFIAYCLSISLQAASLDLKKVFIDDSAKQMWLDDGDDQGVEKSWDDAISYCSNLARDGYDDWKLPDINALENLHENRFLLKHKINRSYWTSTPDATDPKQAANINFCNGNIDWDIKSESFLVRCVRDTVQKIK